MSIQASILKTVLKCTRIKKLFQLPMDQLVKKADFFNKNRNFQIPNNHTFVYKDISIQNGTYHTLAIQKDKTPSTKAILFFFGGAMLLGADQGDVKYASGYVKDCNMDVWFPYYPLCTHTSILDTYTMILETYQKMLEVYEAKNITFVGFSSGASLAIGLCQHIHAQHLSLPLPHKIIACSIGTCPTNEKQFKKMQQLNDKDIMVDVSFMQKIKELMCHGKQVPEYMLCTTEGDFSDFPLIHFWYGEEEVLNALSDDFIYHCKENDIPYTLDVGKGMFHCYPMMLFMPEGKQAYQKICQQIIDNH